MEYLKGNDKLPCLAKTHESRGVAASSQNLASSTEDLNSSHPVSVGQYLETVSKMNLYLSSSSDIAE